MNRFLKAIATVEDWFCGMTILLATLFLTFNVILRYVFHAGFSWSDELIRYVVIWMTFIGSGLCVRKGGNVSVDLVLTYTKGLARKMLVTVINVIGLCFSVVLIVVGTETTISILNTGQLSPALQVPMYLLYASVPVGYLLTAIHFCENIVNFNFSSGSTM